MNAGEHPDRSGLGAPRPVLPAAGAFPPPLPPGAAPALTAPPPPPPPPSVPPRGRRGRWIGGVAGALAVVVLTAGAVVVTTRGSDDASGGGPCGDADGRSGELRRCLGPSMAFVSTDFGSGSGVLIDGGYVVTNVHVVDPFAAADLTFTDGERHDDVPVVGIDAFTDIAVLGPIDTVRPSMTIEPQVFDEGDDEPDVFLVGFPGGIEDDEPAVTISGGILSRTRTDDTLGLTYLQSDAAISGGQSGGALVDVAGRLLGISGLSFAEEFALVLSAADVRSSIDRVLAGDGDVYAALGAEGERSDATTLPLTATSPALTMVLAPDSTRRDIEVTAETDARIGVEVGSASGSVWAVNDALRDSEAFYEEAAELRSGSPGRYTFELPSDEYGFVHISRLDDDAEVTLDADVPFVAHADVADGGPIADGETRGVLQAFAPTIVHEIELDAGDVAEIGLSAGSSDPYFTLLAPGDEYDEEAEPQVDDGGGGLYDLDSFERFEIDESGTWRIVVSTWDGYTTGYALRVTIS